MKIAILSDIHDNVVNLKKALLTQELIDVSHIICCGDLCSAFIIKILSKYTVNQNIHIIFGNNDGDRFRMSEIAQECKRITIYGDFLNIKINNKKIAANHYPDIAKLINESNEFDLVCYGHSHIWSCEFNNSSFFLNSGAILGYDSVKDMFILATFAIYDTVTNEINIYKLLETNNSQLISTCQSS